MKIDSLPEDGEFHGDRRRQVDALMDRLAAPAKRPCPDCEIPCPCSASRSCACACTPQCPKAPAGLSSDPIENPVERNILALVMALKMTDVLAPCWSCEGHTRPDGSLHRLPQVWFYCRSLATIGVLDEAVQSLADKKLLSTRWRVRVVSGLPRTDNAFSLEPGVDAERGAMLQPLQKDAALLAERLPAALRAVTREHRMALNATTPRQG